MAINTYYNTTGNPVQISRGLSAPIRAEFSAIAAAFTKVQTDIAAGLASVDFGLIYQGASATDPTQRRNGTALQNGDLYFNSLSKVIKSFDTGVWYSPIINTSNVMLKDGGTFSGDIFGVNATFSGILSVGSLAGNGAGITGLTSGQIITALGITPLDKAGGTMTGPLNGTTITLTGAATATDFIMISDERGKKKWVKLADDILERFAAIKKIGLFTDKKTGRVKAGAGAQSMQELLPEVVHADENGRLGLDYGAAALVLVHKLTQRVKALEKQLAKK